MLKNPRQLEDDLESDDELPNHYYETPDIPAYQDDSRFDALRFPWLQEFLNKYKQEKRDAWKPFLYSTINDLTVSEKSKEITFGEKVLITNGVLTQGDILCLKSIENSSSDSMLLWLMNFLMYKDLQLQANLNFLRTCLVERHIKKNYDMLLDSCSKSHNFEVVVERDGKYCKRNKTNSVTLF